VFFRARIVPMTTPESVDDLLATTRAVRRRLDLTRPVDPELIRDCIELALQAPTGGNDQGWHFVVVTDAATRAAVADVFRRGAIDYARRERPPRPRLRERTDDERATRERVMASSGYLFEHLHEVPVHVVPCVEGRVDAAPLADQATLFGSILPAVWSFMLAARARGLGTAWTTVHLEHETEMAELLGIPIDAVTQVALVPVAHTVGDRFTRARRRPVDEVVHWDRW
jgi:nitroreductase